MATPPASRSKTPLALGGVAALVLLGLGIWSGTRPESDVEPVAQDAGASEEVEPAPAPPPASTPPSEAPSFDGAYFGAVVVATEGMDATVGEGCVLEVEIAAGPRHVQVRCAHRLHSSQPASGVLSHGPEGYAFRAADAALLVDTLHHEILIEPSEGAFTRLYVAAWGVGPDDVELPEDAREPEGEAQGAAELQALLARVEDGQACEVRGSFEGQIRMGPSALADARLRRTGDGPVYELSSPAGPLRGAVHTDCQSREVVIGEDGRQMTARLGPGYATLIGTLRESGEGESRQLWLRRIAETPAPRAEAEGGGAGAGAGVAIVGPSATPGTGSEASGVEVNVDLTGPTRGNPEGRLGSLPPHVQQAVRRAIERQQHAE